VLVTYNRFEHCGLRSVEIDAGTQNTVSHNINVDCGDAAERQDPGMQNTGNVWDTNSYSYPFGTGQAAGLGENGYYNYVSAGAACHPSGTGCSVDYSGNTMKNSTITGPVANYMLIGNTSNPSCGTAGGVVLPGTYTNNTCTNGCGAKCP
jgi:hypothetical protein